MHCMNLSQVEKIQSLSEIIIPKDPVRYFVVDAALKNKEFPDKRTVYINSPEDTKTWTGAERLIEELLKLGIEPQSTLIGVGGGAISDLAGFVASILFRGIKFEVVPSTLLAMVDASIGGKNSLNTGYSKNTVGSIHLPQKIWIYLEFLNSLPQTEMLSGSGEILKYFLLSETVKDLKDNDLEDIIFACINFKNSIVEKDLYDQGERRLLNFGHTLGHAFEKELKLPHGLAVVLGLYFEVKLYSPDYLKEFLELTESLDLETFKEVLIPFSKEEFFKKIFLDKKKNNQGVDLVILGKDRNRLKKIPLEDIRKKLEADEEFNSHTR